MALQSSIDCITKATIQALGLDSYSLHRLRTLNRSARAYVTSEINRRTGDKLTKYLQRRQDIEEWVQSLSLADCRALEGREGRLAHLKILRSASEEISLQEGERKYLAKYLVGFSLFLA